MGSQVRGDVFAVSGATNDYPELPAEFRDSATITPAPAISDSAASRC